MTYHQSDRTVIHHQNPGYAAMLPCGARDEPAIRTMSAVERMHLEQQLVVRGGILRKRTRGFIDQAFHRPTMAASQQTEVVVYLKGDDIIVAQPAVFDPTNNRAIG